MTEHKLNPAGRAESPAHSVVHRLTWRYLFVLTTVAVLMVVDQAIVQPMLLHVNVFAPAINMAGRQRMLSQKLTKASLALRDAQDRGAYSMRHEELRQSLAQWTDGHRTLLEGNAELGIRPIQTPELKRHWKTLQPHYQAMVAAAGDLIAASETSSTMDTISPLVSVIVMHEAQFLPTMDRIVKLMEEEAARAIVRLRAFALAIAATVVLLLVALGCFVVRPATRTIRIQFAELESRVAHQTSELSETLASLQREINEREMAERNNRRLAACSQIR